MATLSNADRQKVMKMIMELESTSRASIAVTKSNLLAAVNAADDWADTNATAFNNALPTAAKNNLTAKQKALLLSYVVAQRYAST